jgi:ferric-dicitrate binding protein FerR (iron transport regulator)
MDYSRYGPEDFAANQSYLRYYFKLDPVDVFFWQDWISKHPEKLDVIMSADRLISFAAMHLPEEEAQQKLEHLHRTLAGAGPQELPPPAPTTHSRLTRLFAVAGIVAALLVAVAFMFHVRTRPSKEKIAMLEKANHGSAPMKIRLEDGSTVTLHAGTKLRYPQKFAADKREVFLEGEAFFEVSQDAGRPFYVCNNNLVAHVEGTGFAVRADHLRKKIAVTATSGKVEVYERKNN